MSLRFEWDKRKNAVNRRKHGIGFEEAVKAFFDSNHVITEDPAHSLEEKRYFCYGRVDGNVLTVRFTYRGVVVRIIGAAAWRKGKKIYVQKNKISG